MSKRSVIKSGTQSATAIFLTLGILVFANILSYRWFKRADLTDKKEYTISDSTRKILGNLDDLVNITAYFSNDLPPYYTGIKTQVTDLLSEYEAFSNGNLNIVYTDPGSDDELKGQLARMGIPEVPLGEIKRDKQVISMGYMGIAVQYGDNGEVIPFVRGVSNLEYDLTSALLKVKDSTEKVVIWIGTESSDPQDPEGYKLLHDELNKSYVVRAMTPDKVTVIPKRTSMVVVDGKANLPDRALYAIDQFLMGNGKVVFLTDGVQLDAGQGLAASRTSQSIHTLLEHYGVMIEPILVGDVRNANAMFNSGMVRFRMPYPFWPKIGSNGFDSDAPAVSQLESLVFPWVSPLSFQQEKQPGATAVGLVRTSEQSWHIPEPFDLNPQQDWKVREIGFVQSDLVWELTGTLESFFKGKAIPTASDPANINDEKEEEELDPTADDCRVCVVGSTRFANNQFLSIFPENMMFAQNIIDSMAMGNDLIGIRSRIVTDRPLAFGTTDENEIESKKTMHRLMGTILIPVLLILFGLGRVFLRNQKRKQLQSA